MIGKRCIKVDYTRIAMAYPGKALEGNMPFVNMEITRENSGRLQVYGIV